MVVVDPETCTIVFDHTMDVAATWVPLGAVDTQVANLSSDFDPPFGFRKLSDLVRKTIAFEIDDAEGGTLRIRIKPEAEKKGRQRVILRHYAPQIGLSLSNQNACVAGGRDERAPHA
jgi:hypothetical protein